MWESKLGRKNPHNPYRLSATFTISDVSKASLEDLKSNLGKEGVKVSENLVIMEGCP